VTRPGNRLKDITGQRFGRLVVVSRIERPNSGKHAVWLCRCDCGQEREAFGFNLRNGATTSCGCLNQERRVEANTTHGQTDTPAHRSWTDMLSRVRNPNCAGWPNTGGRGIRVHEPWLDFEAFFADLGPRPGPGYCLTRLDKDGDFRPGNLTWQQRTRKRRAKG
jgi:hypothetical protein